MTRRQYFGALLVLSVSGLIGGALSVWLLPGRVAWAQEPPGREIRAESFVLVDANGQTRGSLSLSETGQPTLVLNDEAMTPRAGIALEDGEPIAMSVAEPGRSVVAEITVQPGAAFPWHTHPGPIFVNVASGELVYVPASDCRERHYLAGNVFVDPGRGNVHTAYNASDEVTVLIATFFEVPEEGPLTITEGVEAPEGCDVQVSAHDH